jgi:hypothetical protein
MEQQQNISMMGGSSIRWISGLKCEFLGIYL